MRAFTAFVVMFALLSASGASYRALAQPAPTASPESSTSAQPVPVPTPLVIELQPPKASPAPELITFRQPVVFTVVLAPTQPAAVGADPAAGAKGAVALAQALGKSLGFPVVPEGTWGLGDYMKQCQEDSKHTMGAFIVLPPASGQQESDWLVLLRTDLSVKFNAMLSECSAQTEDSKPKGRADIAWISDTVEGRYGRSVAQFLPFAVLTSVYLAFAPQKTYTTLSTTVKPTPNPIPSAGAITNVQTTSSTVTNASGTSSLQNSIVTSVAAAQLDFGRKGDPNHLVLHAAEDGARQFLTVLQKHCRLNVKNGTQRTPPEDGANFCQWLMPRIGIAKGLPDDWRSRDDVEFTLDNGKDGAETHVVHFRPEEVVIKPGGANLPKGDNEKIRVAVYGRYRYSRDGNVDFKNIDAAEIEVLSGS